jgi:haloacid dehalogenase-like hydrolase
MIEDIPKTIFCDIDGTLVQHEIPRCFYSDYKLRVLPNVKEKILEWHQKSYVIILTTGRKESNRAILVKQLQDAGIVYDQLLMGMTRGERVIINDKKPDGYQTARAINIARNEGFTNIDV